MMASTRFELATLERLLATWMSEARLTLKREKTRVIDMTNRSRSYASKFDFLGYKIHLRAYSDNAKRFWIARQPSEKSRRNLRRAIRERLHAHLPLKVAQQKLTETWRGWCNYFCYGNSNRILQRERDSVRRLIWRYLRRKFRRTRRPVAWARLHRLASDLVASIRPVRMQNSTAGERQLSFRFGGA